MDGDWPAIFRNRLLLKCFLSAIPSQTALEEADAHKGPPPAGDDGAKEEAHTTVLLHRAGRNSTDGYNILNGNTAGRLHQGGSLSPRGAASPRGVEMGRY